MKVAKRVALLSCFGLLLVAFAPNSRASEMDKKTIFSVSTPVKLPGGKVLAPGEYVMQVPPDPGQMDVVEITNRRGNKVYAMVMANSIEKSKRSGKTVITFREAPADQPEAMDSWFYPGRTIGWEFPTAKR